METKFILNQRYKIICFGLIVIGAAAFIYGFLTNPSQTWANLLLNNYYFLSLAIGASFFMALQYITQSGWSSMFKRVPEAMSSFIPVAAAIMLLMFFGLHDLYHWSHQEAASDPIIAHKAPYLNVPFFMIRIVIYFALWAVMSHLLRKFSMKEDVEGGLAWFEKSELYSKVYIFILAITFSFASFDWIMSLDVHWFSNIFALKMFVNGFYHGVAVMILIIILLHEKGHYKELNSSHLMDFSRYLFMLSILWGYFFFAQFMLIWFSNIPEETIYYARMWNNGWKTLFYVNIVINWFLPFIILISKKADRNIQVVKWVTILLIFGFWIDLFVHIFPAITVKPVFGFVEIGAFLGFAGMFALATGYTLSKAPMVPANHPYLEESLYHHVD